MKCTEELENYQKYLLEKELSEQTRKIYLAQAGKFLEYVHGRPITKTEAIAYKKMLLEQRQKPSTIHLKLTAVNSYLRYAGYADSTVKMPKRQKAICLLVRKHLIGWMILLRERICLRLAWRLLKSNWQPM